jgi:hypothetical protein
MRGQVGTGRQQKAGNRQLARSVRSTFEFLSFGKVARAHGFLWRICCSEVRDFAGPERLVNGPTAEALLPLLEVLALSIKTYWKM